MADLSHVAVGTWSGGRFMHFGEALDDERLRRCCAPTSGIDTVLTADAYGAGRGRPRCSAARSRASTASDYCLVGAVGHDFYEGERDGPRGLPALHRPAPARPGRLRRLPADGDRAQPRAHRRRRVRPAAAAQPRPHRLHERGRLGRDGGAARGRADAAARRRARPGERLHARRHRLLRALRRPHRLGDDHPQPARAVAGRARAAGGGRSTTSR